MKGFGTFALIVGVCWLIFALSMDVSVATGVGGRVNNIGLMGDRQIHTIIGSVLTLAGLLMILLGGKSSPALPVADADTRPCPLCAETIKNAAVKCKHCGEDVQPFVKPRTSHGWTVRFQCKKPDELDRVMSLLADTKFPMLEPQETIAIVGFFGDRDEAKSAQKTLGVRYAIHGTIGWVEEGNT